MKRIFPFLIGYLLFVFACSDKTEKSPVDPELRAIADSMQQKYLPDRRVDVFDVEIDEVDGKPVLRGATTLPEAHDELLALARKERPEVLDSILLLPDTALQGRTYGVINLSVADMRVKSGFASEMATQALLGTPVRVLQKGRWYRLQTPDRYISWAESSTFQPMTKEEFNEWIVAPKIVYTDYYGFSYQKPDEKSQTVSDLVYGNILRLEGEEKGFYKVAYPDGRQAFVPKSRVLKMEKWLTSNPLTGESLVKKAFTLMGIPYSWGGTSVKQLDCSGLTKTVFFMHGVILMRDASQQVHTGEPVDISAGYDNLQAGDLMFFGKKTEDGKEKIRHVGFYIGNKEFIHEAGRVKVSSLDSTKTNYDEYNTREFIRAARFIHAVGTPGIWSVADHPWYKVQP
ncbi:C40 family peptidase [Parabacteroides sp. Marseille-P3160]|uniref:C40 family peptidase n=1 Tax=Parabacteroides sp. Marseille-P3160 TaxID=1917887 RepID=UPI0009BC219A|nr:C40 family peptidase [Parabacteroides sp. Marseille-P3160]